MAIYKLFSESDAFLISDSPTANTGKDELLEIGGFQNNFGLGSTIRSLIKFNTSQIQDVVNNTIGSGDWTSNLSVFKAYAYEVPISHSIYAYPVAATWDNGIGKFQDFPIDTSGVSWKFRKASKIDEWPTASYASHTTGSDIAGQRGGGTWFTGSGGINLEAEQEFALNESLDLNINVTNATKLFYSESIDNNGFILKLPNSLEFNTSSSIRFFYFGSDTNTIYPPSLEFKWDDSSYVTGSLTVLDDSKAQINIKNNKGEFKDEGKQRFRLSAKPKYPTRTFTTSSVYLTNYALPEASYWGLKDEHSEDMIVNFDTSYTKVSCDGNGPYFDVYMNGLQPERYYRILIKTTLDGSTTVVDNGNVFKVVRNG